MAKLLSLIAPVAVAVNPTVVSMPVQSYASSAAAATSPQPAPTAQASTASGSTKTASSIGYTPSVDFVFDTYKDVFKQARDDAMASIIGPSYLVLNSLWTSRIEPQINDPNHVLDYLRLLKKSPFHSINEVLKELVTNEFTTLANKVANYDPKNPQSGTEEDFANDFINAVFGSFNHYPDDLGDFYAVAVDDAGLNDFVKSLVQSKVPFKNGLVDPINIINTVADQLLNDVAKDKEEVKEFQDRINQSFHSVAEFKDAIASEIISNYIDYDAVLTSIKSEVEDELKANQTKIDSFGLRKLSADYQNFYDSNIKPEFDDLDSNQKKPVQQLVSRLEAIKAQGLGNAQSEVEEWAKVERDVFIKKQNDQLDAELNKQITEVQTKWAAILSHLPDISSYWDAYSVQKKFDLSSQTPKDSFLALWTLLGSNTSEIEQFLKDYSSDTLSYNPSLPDSTDSVTVVPSFFNAQLKLKYDSAIAVDGQKTIFSYGFQLSKEITNAQADQTKQFIPNYTDPKVKNIYDLYHEKYVTVDARDLKNIILNDFKSNSNPVDSNDLWKVAKPYSSLDLETYWKGMFNGTSVNPDYFETPILTFNTTEDVTKLLPRIDWLISDINGSEFANTLQDTLFGANVKDKANIFIDTAPRPSQTNVSTQKTKYENYDLRLSIQIGSNRTDFDATTELIQANNVEVYAKSMDDDVTSAFKTFLQKTLDNKSKDVSFVSFVVGEFWKWQNITDAKDKVPMTRSFTHLYELLNLIFSNDGSKSIPQVKLKDDDLNKTPEEQEKLLQEYQINQINAIAGIDYSSIQAGVPHPLKLLLNTYPVAKLLENLNVGGTISVSRNQNNGWEVSVDLDAQSIRFKNQNDPTFPAANTPPLYVKEAFSKVSFQMTIHSLTSEIEKAIKEITESIDPYKPLFNKMVGRGDIEQTALNDLIGVKIQGMVDKFKTDVSQIEIASDIVDHAALEKDKIKEEIVNWIAGNREDNDKSKWINGSSKNADAQLDNLHNKSLAAQAELEQHPNYNTIMADKANADLVESYKKLKTAEILTKLVGIPLPDSIKQTLESTKTEVEKFGFLNQLDNVVEQESKEAIIKTPKQGTIALALEFSAKAALKNNDKPYNPSNISEEGELIIEQIAEYLTSADLSDISQFKTLKDILENPLSMQKVELSTPMKAAVIALGSLMGVVGLGTTFSTIRSIKTNKSLREIGDGASIEYGKPWKIMILKSFISVATLAAAAAIITMVFTLGGGI